MNNHFIGIVGEYNPFHSGHQYHIARSRQELGDLPVVVVMSGDFVQRGEPAIYSKFARAEAAVRGGADLVLELPLPWCLSSAEGFARGAVGLLGRLGAEYLSFGSESGNVEELDALSRCLLDPTLQYTIKEYMKTRPELSYARARQCVLAGKAGERAALLETPNNLLAVEYCRAIYELCPEVKPFTVKREGSGHDEMDGDGFSSASRLRRMILTGESTGGEIPSAVRQVYLREEEQGRCAVETKMLEQAILSRLRMVPLSAFVLQPDGADGIGKRLYEAARSEYSYDAVLSAAKTKRYALARLRRMSMCAVLGVGAGESADSAVPPYARVLAFNSRGQELLSRINKEPAVPIITKSASVRDVSNECARLFAAGASAHDFYALAYRAESERKGGADWRYTPKRVEC